MTNNVLIITHKEDYTADFLIDKLNNRNLKYKRLNCEDLSVKNYRIDGELEFKFDGESKFSSIWFRRTKLPDFSYQNIEIQLYVANEYETLLKNLFSVLDCKWISNPSAVYKAENKLFQLKEAKKLGFKIPNTLLTNSKDELVNFYLENKKQVIIKPLAQSKIINRNSTQFLFSNLLKEEHINSIDNFELTPCIYQEKIEKKIELRITVVGKKLFAAAVKSQENENTKIDWRRDDLIFFPIEIPNDIEKICLQLVENLNLKFGAIDMILDSNGNYIFLEINPNGQWAWIETQTGLEISNAIIDELYNYEKVF